MSGPGDRKKRKEAEARENDLNEFRNKLNAGKEAPVQQESVAVKAVKEFVEACEGAGPEERNQLIEKFCQNNGLEKIEDHLKRIMSENPPDTGVEVRVNLGRAAGYLPVSNTGKDVQDVIKHFKDMKDFPGWPGMLSSIEEHHQGVAPSKSNGLSATFNQNALGLPQELQQELTQNAPAQTFANNMHLA